MRGNGDDHKEQSAMNISGTDIEKKVFFGSSSLVLPFILLGDFYPELLTRGGNTVLSWVINTWGWLYLFSVTIFNFAKKNPGTVFRCMKLLPGKVGRQNYGSVNYLRKNIA